MTLCLTMKKTYLLLEVQTYQNNNIPKLYALFLEIVFYSVQNYTVSKQMRRILGKFLKMRNYQTIRTLCIS